MGYNRAGFDVVGVDIRPMPRYPFEFHQADALEYCREYGHEFDVIHASPPCQKYSSASVHARAAGKIYPDLVDSTRELLQSTRKVFVIENVRGAPLRNACMLCGSSFGLNVRRHRYFESNVLILSPGCNHGWQKPKFRSLDQRNKTGLSTIIGVHGHLNYPGEKQLRERAMGIGWMTTAELSQAIPPAYTEFIGRQLMRVVLKRYQSIRHARRSM